MPKKFYISDWHYGHTNVIAFDNRPFKTVDEMNSALVNNWNSFVSKSDMVFVLGDMFWGNATEAAAILRDMNGQKFLIQGNHDRINEVFRKSFVAVEPYMEVDDNNRHVVLSHYPIPFYKNQHSGWYHLYGHVHNSYEWHMTEHMKTLVEDLRQEKYPMYNVGAMIPYMNYTPRTLDEVISGYNKWKENNNVF